MKLSLVQIQTTSRCNGKCIICSYKDSWFDKNPGEMQAMLYTKILTDIINYDPSFSGKFCPYLLEEPFMDKNIVNKIALAAKVLPNCHIEISTNLIAITEEQIDSLVKIYESHRWNGRIMVSYHGTTKEAYERIMGLPYGVAQQKLIYLIKKFDGRLPIWIHTACESHDGKYLIAAQPEIIRFWRSFFEKAWY